MFVQETQNLLSIVKSLKNKDVISDIGDYYSTHEGRTLRIKKVTENNCNYLEYDLSVDLNYNSKPPVQKIAPGNGMSATGITISGMMTREYINIIIRTSFYSQRLFTLSWYHKKPTSYAIEGYGEQIMSALIVDKDNVIINNKHYSMSDKSVAFQEDVGTDKKYSILELMDLCQML